MLVLSILLLLTVKAIAQLETDIDEWKREAKIENKDAFLIDGEKFDYKVSVTFKGSFSNFTKRMIFTGWSTSWDLKIVSNYWFRDPADDIKEVWLKTKGKEPFKLKESTEAKGFEPTTLLKGDDFLSFLNIPFEFMQSINQQEYFEIRFYYTDGTQFSWVSNKKAIKEFEKMFSEAIRIQNKYK